MERVGRAAPRERASTPPEGWAGRLTVKELTSSTADFARAVRDVRGPSGV